MKKKVDFVLKHNITLVIGGCRSGKSSFALNHANNIQIEKEKEKNKIFIATSQPTDFEMEKRVKKHQAERGIGWYTVEEPVNIHETIDEYSKKASVILVDCLTLWVSNLLFNASQKNEISKIESDKNRDYQAHIDHAVELLEKSLESCQCPLFMVSNEVGAGIVPENTIARQFRDLAGFVNQRMAKIADRVVMTVAGIDVEIKPGKGV